MIPRAVRAVGRFWWDFLFGDTPEFFLVTLVVLAVGVLLRHVRYLDAVVLPIVVLASVTVSAWRVRRSSAGR